MIYYKVGRYNYLSESYEQLWTSVWHFYEETSDTFNLDSDYMRVEQIYLSFAERFIRAFNEESFFCTDIESNIECFSERQTDSLFAGYTEKFEAKEVFNGSSPINIESLLSFLRLCLRGGYWCRVKNDLGCEISVGHDYYWVIGVPESFDISDFLKETELYYYFLSNQ